MRVLLTSHGSTGDIFPVIRLGRALCEAGHDVRFATVSLFRDEVIRAGLEYVFLPPDWDQAGFAEAMRDLMQAGNAIELIDIIYRESLPFIDEIFAILSRELEWADVFVSSYLFASLCEFAKKKGVPCAVTTFAHNAVPSRSYPPEGCPRLMGPAFLRRRWNALSWVVANRLFSRKINQIVGAVTERNGVGLTENFLLKPADRVIVTVSPSLFEPKMLWSARFCFTGYLRWQAAEDAEIGAELEGFCMGERVPVLTFGSVTFNEARKVMTRFMRHWPNGKKIIIQAGWAGLTIERPRPEMKLVGQVSHDQLFQYASMVIHHGGAGTTASVLHAGVPHVVIPHIGDQWFFAREVKRLGVGVEVTRSQWPEDLPKAVRAIEKSKKMSKRVRVVAETLANEDGPGCAVAELERLVAERASVS